MNNDGSLVQSQQTVNHAYYSRPDNSSGLGTLDVFFVTILIIAVFSALVFQRFYSWLHRLRINHDVLAILKSRYASGDISREEFDEIRREIERV